MRYHLAIDIGASSGRHMLSHMEDDVLLVEEVYRFENGMRLVGEELCWDIDNLFLEIINGMKECKKRGQIPESIGIDTWAVDFVLLDQDGKRLGEAIGYRDGRTKGMDQKVYELISQEALYERGGIQKQIFNTIYQLMALYQKKPELLEKADALLLIPDYLHYRLTGIKKTEYTNATTTQLVSPQTMNWDWKLLDLLGYPKKLFKEIVMPGTSLGFLREEIKELVGFDCEVIVPATHDTGSAVVSVPSLEENTLYISSGTWSLMGVERSVADCSMNSRLRNFTNEGGYEGRFRYLKNIMGLWMIQSAKKEFETAYSFATLCELAKNEEIEAIVDCNDPRFLAPKSMVAEVRNYCKETNQTVPLTDTEVAAVIYRSLAVCYHKTAQELESITRKHYNTIHVVGGGANAAFLNELTANITKKTVLAGPTEATAIGNIVVQMLAKGELKDLTAARQLIRDSFPITEYKAKGE